MKMVAITAKQPFRMNARAIAVTVGVSSLGVPVMIVVSPCTHEKVIWADATPIVTMMTDALFVP
jgi:hypothetical protein